MTDQTIPADKVRELIEKFKEDTKHDCIVADLRALLPSQQPTTGLLGRWAKHPEHGDVMCILDKPDPEDDGIPIRWIDEKCPDDTNAAYVSMSSLTFPEQTTRPEDVPAGEAWLVNLNRRVITRVVALKVDRDAWKINDRSDSVVDLWSDEFVELISPLTPERPESDLQAKYDALDAKYREAVEYITELEQASPPRTVTTPEEYDALPVGSMVQISRGSSVMEKFEDGLWRSGSTGIGDTLHSSTTRTVLRYGWGDEQPAWRIEHEWWNLRVGEYMIDYEDYDGTVTHISPADRRPCTDGLVGCTPQHSPWIVFPSKDSATPEAIKEAKKAMDKEMGK